MPTRLETLRGQAGIVRRQAAYARRLGPWLRTPLDLDAARTMVRRGIERREDELLVTLRDGVYAQPHSPYLPILRHAGVELGDIEASVRGEGIEGTLARLYDAGVRITLDELKGRVPITRPGLELEVGADAFVNPLARGDFRTITRGSSGVARTVNVDLRRLERDAAHTRLFQQANGLEDRPIAAWRPSLPATPGINAALQHAKLGQRTDRWFAQLSPYPPHESLRSAGLLGATLAIAARNGNLIPRPRHVALERADLVAHYLAELVAAGVRPFLNTTASGAVRVCEAARAQGLDVSDTVFRVGGEPYTAARARVLAREGCVGLPMLQANEVGRIGVTCATRDHLDEVHLLRDKLAVLRRDVDARTRRIEGALVLTTVWSGAPKLLLNVESDDTAVVEEGPCGCPLGDLGQTTRLHTVRSWEKLTSEGMTFTSAMLLHLVEEVLPGRFGGGPTDWQLVEDRSGALSDVRIVVSPRVGPADAEAIRQTAFQTLAEDGPGPRLMVDSWRAAGLPRVERREPYATSRPKVLPLHVIEAAG